MLLRKSPVRGLWWLLFHTKINLGINNLYKFGNKCVLLPNLYYICISFTTNMNGVKGLILSFASSRKEFSTDELWDWISQDRDIVRNTVNITLSRLVSKGEIMKVSRGVYAMAKGKSIFRAVLEDREIQVAEILRNKYPFAPFCIYNGKSLVPLQHHLSENNVTYVETDRSAMEAVFNTLKDAGYEVWLKPSEDITYKYIDLRKAVIIVKPLVTEAPTEKINDINVPTIEKLLVDIKKDEDFAYLQGSEAQRMWEIGESLYNINQSRLKRYAKRRGLTYNSAV